MQLALMEVFAKDMNWRIPEDLGFNKPVNYLVVNYILNHTKHYWVMPDTEAGRQRKQLMTVAYISVTYGYSLRGYRGFWVYCQRLIDGIHIGKYDRRETHVFVSVMGRFRGEDRYRMHLLPLIHVTQSGIRIRMWLERLVALLKSEGRTNCPEFCG